MAAVVSPADPSNLDPALRAILDALLEGCQVLDHDLRHVFINDVAVRALGRPREEVLGRTLLALVPGLADSAAHAAIARCLREQVASHVDLALPDPAGELAVFEARILPVPAGVLILTVEITERRRAETALVRTQRALLTRSAISQSLVGATEEQALMTEVCHILVRAGYRQAWIGDVAPGTDVIRAVTSAGAGTIDGAVPTRALHMGAAVITRRTAPDDAPSTLALPVAIDGGPVTCALTINAAEPDAFDEAEVDLLTEIAADLGFGIETVRTRVAQRRGAEELKRTQAQFIAAQRLEAVARLAGGVAHDFNNILSVIMSYADFSLETLGEADPLRDDLQTIQDAARRAATLTRQLLAFSRTQVLEPQVLQLNQVITELQKLLGRLIGEDVALQLRLDPALGTVHADPGQIEQVLMNLIVNARDAMPQGGTIVIETARVEIAAAEAVHDARPGVYVMISVTDDGAGMTAEVRHHVFEPFFTTKPKGRGTGLGLPTVHGIVTQSGGTVSIESARGQGTTVTLLLPELRAAGGVEVAPPPVSGRPGGSEVILLVEDEPAVLRIAERILRAGGYTLLVAEGGPEALRLAAAHPGAIDLLLTDVVMPQMSGRELAERLAELRPTMRILYMSGYTEDAILHHGVTDAGVQLLPKPFTAAALARRVRDVIDAPARVTASAPER